jgi:hypothetical protein
MKAVIEQFDLYLDERGLVFEATIIGGAALIVLGIINRATKDLDCLDPSIPDEIKQAAKDFSKPAGLDPDWLNNGQEALKDDLPGAWRDRLQPLYIGSALKLYTLGRIDLLRSKLFAYCDRQQDFNDCIALNPSIEELDEIIPWLKERDSNPLWPDHVDTSLEFLMKELGNDTDL